MTTPTLPKPQTIDELKQAAQTRAEQARLKAQQQAEAARAAAQQSERELLSYLMQESDLGRATVIHLEDGAGEMFDTVVTFELAGHAEIQARYTRREQGTRDNELKRWLPGAWKHEGFNATKYDGGGYPFRVPDAQKMWRVRAFDCIEWEPEDDEYQLRYVTTDYEDLGDALLAAERAFVDPAQVERQLKEANATKAFTYPDKANPPAPEPTTEERFMAALKDLILEFA